jgi:hypothetical protein
MSLDKITDKDICWAAQMDELDDACGALQFIAGIDDGGVAALCFSDLTLSWAMASIVQRISKLRQYLNTERAYRTEDT